MAYRYALRPVDLDFTTDAPTTLRFRAVVPASRQVVFAALTNDPSTWARWFPGLSWGRYEGQGPYGVGSVREVRVGGTGYRETILAWDEPSRWAWRVDAATVPLARALVEEWLLEDHADGTTVRWVFAIDPTPLFQAGLPLAPAVMGRIFRRAMGNLGRQLTGTAV